MKKLKILFVIHRLNAGGAEKSLVSLLNALSLEDYYIDLMAIDPTGIFRSQVPASVNFVSAPAALICQSERLISKRFWCYATIKLLCVKIISILGWHIVGKRMCRTKSHDQYYNDVWKCVMPDFPNLYDVAVSYIDYTNYYVIDHVKAKKKILWCHNDYNKLEYIPKYDWPYYNKAFRICTISELCKCSLVQNFPDLADKFCVIENISSSLLINMQSNDMTEMINAHDGFGEDKRFKIISIGRLTEQKGFDYAIETAKNLKDAGIEFCWYIMGDGPLHGYLEHYAKQCNVSDSVKFIGIRSNPYPYIKMSDIFVMTSRYEGKSIALDEAKILCKPIVVTAYPSVNDAITNGVNGLVSDINSRSISECIRCLYNNKQLREQLVQNLKNDHSGNETEVVGKFINLIS